MELGDVDSEEAEAIKQAQAIAMASIKAAYQPLLAIKKAKQDKRDMAVDDSSHPKREIEDAATPDDQNPQGPKRRAGQRSPENGGAQTVIATTPAEKLPTQTAPPPPSNTAASSSKDGGQPPPQASPNGAHKEGSKAAARKAESDAMLAELELQASTAAAERATAAASIVSAQVAAVPAGEEDDDIKNL